MAKRPAPFRTPLKAHKETFDSTKPSTLTGNVGAQLTPEAGDAVAYLERKLPGLRRADFVRFGLIALADRVRQLEEDMVAEG